MRIAVCTAADCGKAQTHPLIHRGVIANATIPRRQQLPRIGRHPMHLEALSNAEEKVEVRSLALMGRVIVEVVDDRIHRRIKVIAEIHTDRPNRCPVTRPQPYRVREIIKITSPDHS